MFENTEDSTPSFHSDEEDELRYNRYELNESTRRPTPHQPSKRSVVEVANEEEKNPTYCILPYVKQSTVELKFPRKTLEEFMDRYVYV